MAAIFCFFTWLFFITVFLILYSYVIFPGILGFLVVFKKRGKNKISINKEFPGISIIISVYNEEKVLHQKIESIINSNYPKENIEVIIGSDFSNDGSADIVRKFMTHHAFIKLFEFTERRGKPSVINELVAYATHPILIFTDANVFFEKEMLNKLTKNFIDDSVGLVGANILNIGLKKDGISVQEKSYIERENLIKYREGLLWGCMMGPFGGCYAIRKNLFEKVPAGFLVDDFYISMKIIEKGYKCINDLEAICYEDVSNDIRQEYKRKSRISAGNFQNLKAFGKYLLKPFTPAGFCFISHKFLRWITPFLIILSLLSLIVLSFYNKIYFYLLIGEVVLLCSPLIDKFAVKLNLHFRLLRFISYFVYMNFALLKGFFRFTGGISSGVWTPTRRD